MPNYLGGLDAFIGDIGRRRPGRAMVHHSQHHSVPQMGPRASAASNRANRVAEFVNPDVPGSPARDAAMLPAGFPVFAFALATGTNIISQQMNVQTPFRGQRLTAQVIRNGASANTTAPLIALFVVGQKPIITTPNGVPLEIFAQNAFDTNLLLPPTIPGVIYQMGLNLTAALTTTDTLTCLVGVLGSAVL